MHDTDSTFSSTINIDDIVIQGIITDQTKWEGEFSTTSKSSGPTENVSIVESDDNSIYGYRYFENDDIGTHGYRYFEAPA